MGCGRDLKLTSSAHLEEPRTADGSDRRTRTSQCPPYRGGKPRRQRGRGASTVLNYPADLLYSTGNTEMVIQMNSSSNLLVLGVNRPSGKRVRNI